MSTTNVSLEWNLAVIWAWWSSRGLFGKKPTQTSCTIYTEKNPSKITIHLHCFPQKWMAFYDPRKNKKTKKTAKHCSNSFKLDLAPHASAMAYRFEPPGATTNRVLFWKSFEGLPWTNPLVVVDTHGIFSKMASRPTFQWIFQTGVDNELLVELTTHLKSILETPT